MPKLNSVYIHLLVTTESLSHYCSMFIDVFEEGNMGTVSVTTDAAILHLCSKALANLGSATVTRPRLDRMPSISVVWLIRR